MELSAGDLPSRDPGVFFLHTVGCPQSCVRFVSELEYLSNKNEQFVEQCCKYISDSLLDLGANS